MDRNSIVGILLIGVILVGYSIFTKPQREAQAEAYRRADSVKRTEEVVRQQDLRDAAANVVDPLTSQIDSLKRVQQAQSMGVFASGLQGENEMISMENDVLKIDFSTQGGRPYVATLKEYNTHDSLPVRLFYGDSSRFDLQFFADNRRINTGELFFDPQTSKKSIVLSDNNESLSMRLDVSEDAYIEYIYTMKPGEYMIDFDIHMVGMDQYRTDNMTYQYEVYFPSTERGYQNESNYSTLFYRFKDGDIEKFNMRSKKDITQETVTTSVDWIAYKHQFFSAIMLSKDGFPSATLESEKLEAPNEFVRHFTSNIDMPYTRTADQTMSFQFYFGPNHHKTLKAYEGTELHSLVIVASSITRWIDEFAIIPMFNWLSKHFVNYGIIILIMTIIIKLVLFPLMFRSYRSQAVMRVLKPQVDEISAKYPKQEDAMKKQQATMALYKKAGANPMGGCLPMVVQMPILFAMFRFFPTSIELRQQSFLWADDLSTYDSILNLPFEIPIYGDHISLFTILMTVTTLLSMRMSNQTQANSAVPGMKTMMYIMPVMFMVMLNNFSAALTYYYFLANVITLGQNWIAKRFIDEEEILKKINSKKAKPKKKSRWQARIEEMNKQQQKMAKKKR